MHRPRSRNYGSEPSTKIAAFDLDGTLIATKSGNTFAKDHNDWKFFNRTVSTTLKQCIAKGMRIVIFRYTHTHTHTHTHSQLHRNAHTCAHNPLETLIHALLFCILLAATRPA